MVSELQRIAQALLVTVDELPGLAADLAARAGRLYSDASLAGDVYRKTGDLGAKQAALQMHFAAGACERAASRATEAHKRGRAWVVEMVGGGGTVRIVSSAAGSKAALNRRPRSATVIVDNRFTYQTDEHARVVSALALLDAVDLEHERDDGAQRRLEGKLEGDDAGHLFARIFLGPGGMLNLTPMEASKVNRGRYKVLENRWRRLIEDGNSVTVLVELIFKSDTRRPDTIVVEYEAPGHEPEVFRIRNKPRRKHSDDDTE